MRLSIEAKLFGGLSMVAAGWVLTGLWLRSRHVSSLLDLVDADTSRFLSSPMFSIGKLAVTPVFLIKSCVFLLLLTLATRALRKALYSRILARTALAPQYRFALARFASILLFIAGLIAGLDSVGLNLGSLAILGGTLGVGIGFGLQPLVANWVSGLVLLVEQPIRIGDRIDIANMSGVVMRIGGRSTWVRTYDNEVIIVPNSEFTSQRITNWTANDPKIRLAIPVGVAYGCDLDEVRETLQTLAAAHPLVLKDPAPEAVITQLGDSTVNFKLRFWTIVQPTDNLRLESDLYFSILKTFAEKNIEMPYPQMDLHLRSADAPLVIESQTPGGARSS